MRPPRPLLFLFAGAVAIAGSSSSADARSPAQPNVSSLASSAITVYAAKWCSACRSLERGLTERQIAFEVIDVDDNPSAFAKARASAGATNAIPLTGIAKSSGTVWVVGADIDAVDRAHKGD